MLKRIVFPVLVLTLSLSVLASGEDFAFARPRPLMAVCAELREKFGLSIIYEDAPYDGDRELDSEIIPRNGSKALTPKWKPITFHMPSDLPTLAERSTSKATVDPRTAFAVVQTLVNQYNESGNPGHFSVIQDGEVLHIQQTSRMVSGKLEPFEPISETLLPWEPNSENCYRLMGDLSASLLQARGFAIAEGVVPSSSLMHHCNVNGSSVTVRQVLVALANGLATSNVTGKKMVSYTWDLVYDPNWNKYFLSFSRVPGSNAQPSPAENPQPTTSAPKVKPVQGPNRVGAPTVSKPQN